MKKRIHIMLIFALAAVALTATAQAQSSQLANLPESDALAVVNARRVINEVLPRILPEAEYAKVKTHLDKAKQFGVDLSSLDSAVVGLRFKGLMQGQGPEILFSVRGSFNADAMLSLARMGLQGKFTEQKVGSKTITILNLTQLMGPGAKSPLPGGLTELALASLDANTLVGGALAYVKDALNADGEAKRINPELVALATRDTSALLNFAAVFQPGAIANFLPAEMKGNTEVVNMISGIDQVLLTVGMDAANFPLALMIRAANAEQANTLSGLAQMGIGMAAGSITDPTIKNIVNGLKITTEAREVHMQAAIPQSVVASLVSNAMRPAAAKQEAKPGDKTQTKPATKPDATKKP